MRDRTQRLAVLVALLLAMSQPGAVRAADVQSTNEGIVNLLRYAACAAATFLATTPQQMGQAMIGCGLIYLDQVPNNP